MIETETNNDGRNIDRIFDVVLNNYDQTGGRKIKLTHVTHNDCFGNLEQILEIHANRMKTKKYG